jgi:hypothetical protein
VLTAAKGAAASFLIADRGCHDVAPAPYHQQLQQMVGPVGAVIHMESKSIETDAGGGRQSIRG